MQFLKVFLRSSAGEIELSTVSPAPFKLLDGARGLGLPVRSVESTPLPSANGSVFRSGRFDESEVYLPIALNDRDASRVAERSRQLENVLKVFSDDPIELVVEAPELGTVRRRYVYYVEGLEGAIGGEDSHFTWRHVPVKFLALDPMWYGQERVLSQKVDAARKPFITKGTGPLPTGRVNLVLNPSLSVAEDGWAPYRWTGTAERVQGLGAAGDWFYRMKAAGTMTGASGRYVDHPAPVSAGELWTASVFVRPSRDLTMQTQGELRDASGVVGEAAIRGERMFCKADEWTRLYLTIEAAGPATVLRHQVYLQSATVYSGDAIDIDGEMVSPGELVDYFDGDTAPEAGFSYEWLGEPGKSQSHELQAQAEPQYRAPFFPVILASSTVDGAYQLDIQGDAEAWPIWEIDGPGEDLLIENVETGERIFIEGEFGETVTIDTRPTVADIYTASDTDGELWERVSDDYTLFPLTPGENRIKLTMVNANPKSVVRLKYSETWLAGW